jgi:hypothetical protein
MKNDSNRDGEAYRGGSVCALMRSRTTLAEAVLITKTWIPSRRDACNAGKNGK